MLDFVETQETYDVIKIFKGIDSDHIATIDKEDGSLTLFSALTFEEFNEIIERYPSDLWKNVEDKGNKT